MTVEPERQDGDLEGLRYEVAGSVATITIDRPERGNALTTAMHIGLRGIWERVKSDSRVRAVVLTGSGSRHFCTGADVQSLADHGIVSAGEKPRSDELFYTNRENGVWKPVICAVNGLAAGAGLQFVVDADVVVATTTASFTDTHVNLGMVGALETIGLAKRLPAGAALRLILMGRNYRMTAMRGYELGLVDELTEPAELLPTALEMAHTMALASPAAVTKSLQAFWSSFEIPYSEALDHGWEVIKSHRGHPDAHEGPAAFVEGREPRWSEH